MKDYSQKILVSLTGYTDQHWQSKISEIKKLKLDKIALFLEMFKPKQRQNIYEALLDSGIKTIPFVHMRDDMTKTELKFLTENFQTKCFNIHEYFFDFLDKWRGYYQKLYLEMNYDNKVETNVDINKIGGFCVDLAHFKAAMDRETIEYDFVGQYKSKENLFKCNHLSGYDEKQKKDLHTVSRLNQFDYLQTLPEFIFGDYIAIEIFNPLSEQLKYKKHLVKLLNKKKTAELVSGLK